MNNKNSWAIFARSMTSFGIMAASVFGGRDLKQSLNLAGQTGAIDATLNLIAPLENLEYNPIEPITDEMQAKNKVIEGLQEENQALKKQISDLSTKLDFIMAKLIANPPNN